MALNLDNLYVAVQELADSAQKEVDRVTSEAQVKVDQLEATVRDLSRKFAPADEAVPDTAAEQPPAEQPSQA